jgi:hypothetical protein
MELKGKVHEIGNTIDVNEKFKKRELIIEYAENPQYPEFIKIEAQQDKTSLLDGLKVGDEVEAFFNLRGRPWTNKEGVSQYFNTLVIWRVVTLSGAQAPEPEYARPVDISSSSDDDDLPF